MSVLSVCTSQQHDKDYSTPMHQLVSLGMPPPTELVPFDYVVANQMLYHVDILPPQLARPKLQLNILCGTIIEVSPTTTRAVATLTRSQCAKFLRGVDLVGESVTAAPLTSMCYLLAPVSASAACEKWDDSPAVLRDQMIALAHNIRSTKFM